MRVMFIDLDGTLLGRDYSAEGARPIVEELLARGYEVVVNTSKTRAEVEYYLDQWNLSAPFVVENGGAVYIPDVYFPVMPASAVRRGRYRVFEFGVPYDRIRSVLDGIAPEYGLKYYGNSSVEELVAFTGLPSDLVRLAAQREYSETIFSWERNGFERPIQDEGLRVMRGTRFLSVTGQTDKGGAASALLEVYRKFEPVESYAIGDGENDFPLFEVVDRAFIVGNLSHPKAKHISSVDELLGVIS